MRKAKTVPRRRLSLAESDSLRAELRQVTDTLHHRDAEIQRLTLALSGAKGVAEEAGDRIDVLQQRLALYGETETRLRHTIMALAAEATFVDDQNGRLRFPKA